MARYRSASVQDGPYGEEVAGGNCAPSPPAGACTPAERRARCVVCLVCVLVVAVLGLAGCDFPPIEPMKLGERALSRCRLDCEPFGVAMFGWHGQTTLCICGEPATGGAR